MNDQKAMAALIALPGIGPWSAAIYLMSALGRIDVWPSGDLALRNAVAEMLPGVDAKSLADSGDRWQPRRAVAARLVWHHYRNRRNKKP
jgi:DNA-3-methyladenine glycosylase II